MTLKAHREFNKRNTEFNNRDPEVTLSNIEMGNRELNHQDLNKTAWGLDQDQGSRLDWRTLDAYTAGHLSPLTA